MKQCGFTIVAIVSDLGGGNRKLYNELEVDFNKPWYVFENTHTHILDYN